MTIISCKNKIEKVDKIMKKLDNLVQKVTL
jgi:hypothetical protein